ncbi:hypothetical protein CL176_09685 [Suicoccus acidiformans]|uniref:PepSY domain-containing protein n=1 Tax=Suicoccus acidiformans TaxID=2036206 RepID=A0A347WMD7_9LACT|nr:PepSY domain-containing protein [Suicoccus acidiformans]AXY26244.1 hypothetical protein CL176_09685 [Suicoccus acidiformans]
MEAKLGIIPVQEALAKYSALYPKDQLTKLQIEHEGPFLKYEMVGNDGQERHIYEFNAATEEVLKERSRPMKPKQKEPSRLARRALNTTNLLPLSEITEIALKQVPVDNPYQWELDRKKERTVWKVEIADQRGGAFYEVKVDAQDGTVVEYKVK